MNDEQLNIFKKAFREANSGLIDFPEDFYEDKINEIEFYTEGMRGGRKVRFFMKKNEIGKLYIDLFAGTDFQSWHKRIEHDGTIKDLENFQGDFGRTIYPDDPERTKREWHEIQVNNSNVRSILVKKGLERNFENPEFEKQKVVRLTYKQFM
jgi:hypothetical protein